ncbi:uncharacterized protein [Mycetomoellerius zeteki]|uniref:uncharacterized protein n=1 Tax=Mycetomoellerius zeteki TaxID=64791 RepID=UPI00084ED0DF|nr:PREDICTED: uncharacterized protein LOC108728940 [Trachymyrmex zeteki]
MAITDDNFNRAWETLVAFYENKRMLVNAALHSLLNLKRMTKESAMEMEHLYTTIMQIYRSLESLHRPVGNWDDFLVFLVVQRLDSESVKAWEHHLGATRDPPTWHQLTDFLHYTSSCPQYTTKSLQQRLALVTKRKLCFNCLGTHRVAVCRNSKRCVKCGRKHHTSIHLGVVQPDKALSEDKERVKPVSSTVKSKEAQVMHSSTITTSSPTRVLLATAKVRVTSPNGYVTTVRALIDQGSEISLISERTVQRMRMPRTRSTVSLVGIGARSSNKTRGVISMSISPHFVSDFRCNVSAHILTSLTSALPSLFIDKDSWPHLEGLQLADSQFYRPGSIDLILGADVYGLIKAEGIIKGSPDSPVAQLTNLGWIVSGPTGHQIAPEDARSCHIKAEEDLFHLLQKFWELEEIPTSVDHLLSPEEQDCEDHFQSTHSRDSHGRYMVRLPFKRSINLLGDSKRKATLLLNKLNKRFELDSTYFRMYSDFIKEYVTLHHMELLSASQPEIPSSYYLPHHGVLKKEHLTTKLRVVFNGSSKTTSGFSLNDLLHVGSKLRSNLFDVLI